MTLGGAGLLLAVLVAALGPVLTVLAFFARWGGESLLPLATFAAPPLALGFYLVGERVRRFGWAAHLIGLPGIVIGQVLAIDAFAGLPGLPTGEEPGPGDGLILLPAAVLLMLTLLLYLLALAGLWWGRWRSGRPRRLDLPQRTSP